MARNTSSISVSKGLKETLETAKGEQSWEAFLQALLANWHPPKATPPPAPAPPPVPPQPPILKFDVTKAWSMRLTEDGIRIEQIPPAEPEGPSADLKTKKYPA